MNAPYYTTPGYLSAVAHPFHVSLYADWYSDPTTVGFQAEDDARAFAQSRPEPIIDLVQRGRGVIGSRRMLAHPAGIHTERDDFPQIG